MKRAHLLAREYRIAIDQSEDGACTARCLELPSLRFVSHDLELAVSSLRQLVAAELTALVERGDAPAPLRASQGALGAWVEELELVESFEPVTELETPGIESLWNIARATARRYRVIVECDEEIIATCAEVAGPRGVGTNVRQATEQLREQLTEYVLALLQANRLPPEARVDVEGRMKGRIAA